MLTLQKLEQANVWFKKQQLQFEIGLGSVYLPWGVLLSLWKHMQHVFFGSRVLVAALAQEVKWVVR